MTKDEALKLALEALEDAAYCVQKNYLPDEMGHDWDDTIAAIKEALAQPPAEQPLQPDYRLVPLVPTDAMQVFVHKQAWINAVNAAPLPVQEPVGVVQCVSISGYPMQDSRGVEWLCAVPIGSKLYTSPLQENT